MMSLVSKYFGAIKRGETIDLFRSYRPDFADGEQSRDFVYVMDVTDVILWLLDKPAHVGLFNIGSGKARSFLDLVGSIFDALGLERRIRFVEMPEAMRPRYQYFTHADTTRLRAAGYNKPGTDLEAAVGHFVHTHLDTGDQYR
jgi:ADP-L-glycero-D-manno-heptose 6-epimerase